MNLLKCGIRKTFTILNRWNKVMKLKNFTQKEGYKFQLVFENGEIKETDLKNLIGHHVSLDDVKTARIDSEWGCGVIDITPKTLYKAG